MIQVLDKYGNTSTDDGRVVIIDKFGNIKKPVVPTGTVTSILTASPITGGPITSSGTIGITQATTSTDGYLSSTDWNTFNSKFNLPVLNAGGVLFSDGTTIVENYAYFSWDNVNARLGVGTNAPVTTLHVVGALIAGNALGTTGLRFTPANDTMTISGTRVIERSGSQVYYGYTNQMLHLRTNSNTRLYIDNEGNVGINTTAPTAKLQVEGTITATSALARGTNIAPTLVASANSDVLVGLDINPTFTTGSFSGVTSAAIRLSNNTPIIGLGSSGTNLPLISTAGTGTVIIGGTFPSTPGIRIQGSNIVFANASTTFGAFYTGTGNLALQNGGGFTDDGVNRLQVNGPTKLNGLQTFQGTTASDSASLGAELATTATGTNWTGTSFATGYTHTIGSTVSLVSTLAAVIGNYYQIAYTITGRTAGSITINYGGIATSGITETGTTGPIAIATNDLNIVPTTDFNGVLVLSIRIIGTSLATTSFTNSAGIVTNELRVSSSNSNVFLGINAGRRNTTSTNNTFIGSTTGQNNTTGRTNTFIGSTAGLFNTTGNNNLFAGVAAGYSNTIGTGNTFIGGYGTGLSNTTAVNNTSIGSGAGQHNTTGNNNVLVGVSSGRFISNGSILATILDSSTMIGFNTRPLADNQSNQIVIGYDSIGLGSNTTVLGNSSTVTTAIYGNLLVGTTTTNGSKLNIQGTVTATSAIARGQYLASTLVASANGDTLIGLDIQPTINSNGFSQTNYSLRTSSDIKTNTSIKVGVLPTPTISSAIFSNTGGALSANTYYYRIVAYDIQGQLTTSSSDVSVTTSGSTGRVLVSWNLIKGCAGYRLYRGTVPGGQTTFYNISGINTISYNDIGSVITSGFLPLTNNSSYGIFNNAGLRTNNITIANGGIGDIASIFFEKSTDSASVNVVEYSSDSTMYEFKMADNPDSTNDFFHWFIGDWQNASTGWKPLKLTNISSQFVGQSSNFWSSFLLPSSGPYFTTNPDTLANASIKGDPYTSNTYSLLKETGSGTGTLNVGIAGFTGSSNKIYWVTITSPTTFNWGTGNYLNTPSATNVTITGNFQTLDLGVQIKLSTTGQLANDRWAFRAFPTPKMGIGTSSPVAPFQVSSTVTATGNLGRGSIINPTLVASANNDVLVGLDVNPTFTTGSFINTTNGVARFNGTTQGFIFADWIGQSSNFSIYPKAVPTVNNYLMRSDNQNLHLNAPLTSGILTFKIANATFGQFMPTTGNFMLQNGGTFTDVASSRLTINSTTQGVLLPRMTTAEVNAIVLPVQGLTVFNTDLNTLCFYTTSWQKVTSTTM